MGDGWVELPALSLPHLRPPTETRRPTRQPKSCGSRRPQRPTTTPPQQERQQPWPSWVAWQTRARQTRSNLKQLVRSQ